MKRRGPRQGISLLELIVSMTAVTILIGGLGATLGIAVQSLAVRDAPVSKVVQSTRLSEFLAADLRIALRFSERTSSAVTFTVPDRDGDRFPETIRWAWLGVPNHQVTRLLHFSKDVVIPPPQVVATGVDRFDLSYTLRTWGDTIDLPDLESEPTLLLAHDNDPPGDGFRVLQVVSDTDSPRPGEITRQSWLEQQGFHVTRMGQNTSAAELAAAVAGHDIVYVTSEVSATAGVRSLAEVTCGVVNELPEMMGELGLSLAVEYPPASAVLEVNRLSHFITAPLGTGSSTILNSPQAGIALSSQAQERAPDAMVLGSWTSASALATVLPGEKLASAGGATPGQFGFTTPFAQQGSLTMDKLHAATQVTVPSQVTATSISAYLYMKNSKTVRMGIYADVSGQPGQLLRQTNAAALPQGTGWYTLDLIHPLDLTPGTYWLAIGMQKDMAYFYDAAGGAARVANSGSDPKNGLMANWTGTQQSTSQRLAICANYDTARFAPGRRVQLPWGGPGFSVLALQTSGWDLLSRAIAWAADPTPQDPFEPLAIAKDTWPAQYFHPAMPLNATGWKVSRVFVCIKGNPDKPDGKVRFQLRYAALGQIPGASIIQETAEIRADQVWDFYRYQWYEIPFNETGELDPSEGICLVLKGRNNVTDAFVKVDRSGENTTEGTHLLETADQGANWSSPAGTADLRIYVVGKYLTQGTPQWP